MHYKSMMIFLKQTLARLSLYFNDFFYDVTNKSKFPKLGASGIREGYLCVTVAIRK